MTHASGLQYSYDDLDLVCCHGLDVEGLWLGPGSSQPGQRTRCASMPEGCPQLPTEELSQTATNEGSQRFQPMQPNVKVPVGLEEESAHSPSDSGDVDTPQGASGLEHLQTSKPKGRGGPQCNPNRGPRVPKVACETVRMRTSSREGEIATAELSSQDANVCRRTHVSAEEQQGISVPSNNECLLNGCAGEKPGGHPAQQQTMEKRTEGHRPPEPFGVPLNQSSATGAESPCGLPDVEAGNSCTSEQADAGLIPAFDERGKADNTMEHGDGTTRTSTAAQALVEEVHGIPSRSSNSTRKPHGIDPAPPTQNATLGCNIQNEDEGCEREQDKEKAELTFGLHASSEDCPNNKAEPGSTEKHLERVTIARADEGRHSVFALSARHESQIVAPQFENSCLQLDAIPEVSHSVLPEAPVHACKDRHFGPNPDVRHSNIPADKNPRKLPEDCHELSPQHLHSNREASACDLSEPPGSKMAHEAPAPKEGDGIQVRPKKVSLPAAMLACVA